MPDRYSNDDLRKPIEEIVALSRVKGEEGIQAYVGKLRELGERLGSRFLLEYSEMLARSTGGADSGEAKRYWVSTGMFDGLEGTRPQNIVSARLCIAANKDGIERRWSNEIGGYEYALSVDEICRHGFSDPTRLVPLFIDELRPVLEEEQVPLDFANGAKAYWIHSSTFKGDKGAYQPLHIAKNLRHAAKEGGGLAREYDGKKEFLVLARDLSALCFRDKEAVSESDLEGRLDESRKVYAVKIKEIPVAQRRHIALTLSRGYKRKEVARIQVDSGRVYFLTAEQMARYCLTARDVGSDQRVESPLDESPADSHVAGDDYLPFRVAFADVLETLSAKGEFESCKLRESIDDFVAKADYGDAVIRKGRGYRVRNSERDSIRSDFCRFLGLQSVQSVPAYVTVRVPKDVPRGDVRHRNGSPTKKRPLGEAEELVDMQRMFRNGAYLSLEDEFRIGEEMSSARAGLAELLFRSDYGISLLLDRLKEVSDGRQITSLLEQTGEGYVDRFRDAYSDLRRLHRQITLDYAVFSDLRDDDRRKPAVEQAITAGRERIYELLMGLGLKRPVVTTLATRFLQTGCPLLSVPDNDTSIEDVVGESRDQFARRCEQVGAQYNKYVAERDKLITTNTKFVLSVVKQHRHRLALNDLVMEGMLGLMNAAEYHDHRRGVPFKRFAFDRISQRLSRAFADQEGVIRVPERIGSEVRKVHREVDKLRQELAREPLEEEVYARGIPPEVYKRALLLSKEPVSLDAPLSNGKFSLAEVIPDTTSMSVSEGLDNVALYESIAKALEKLDARSKAIITAKFGVGQSQGNLVDSERVSPIAVTSALIKLRKILEDDPVIGVLAPTG